MYAGMGGHHYVSKLFAPNTVWIILIAAVFRCNQVQNQAVSCTQCVHEVLIGLEDEGPDDSLHNSLR